MAETKPEAQKPGPRKPRIPPKIEIKVSWCKSCGLCVDYCNLGVLEMNGALPKVVKLEKCTRCMQCEVICPDFAITVRDTEPGTPSEDKPSEGSQ